MAKTINNFRNRVKDEILEFNARNQGGEMYSQMPERLFNIPDPIDWKNPMHAVTVLASATRKQAQHQWEESYQQLTEANNHKSDIMPLYQLELENMMTLACIATGRDEEARQHNLRSSTSPCSLNRMERPLKKT